MKKFKLVVFATLVLLTGCKKDKFPSSLENGIYIDGEMVMPLCSCFYDIGTSVGSFHPGERFITFFYFDPEYSKYPIETTPRVVLVFNFLTDNDNKIDKQSAQYMMLVDVPKFDNCGYFDVGPDIENKFVSSVKIPSANCKMTGKADVFEHKIYCQIQLKDGRIADLVYNGTSLCSGLY